MDRTACGVPDVSYHGESAWQIKDEVSSRQLGVLYSAAGPGDQECFIAYNMHWIPHTFALPSPGKGRGWKLAADTQDGILEDPASLKEQKSIELRERSITILTGTEMKEKADKGKGRKRA